MDVIFVITTVRGRGGPDQSAMVTKGYFFMREEVLGYKQVGIGMGKVKKYVMASRSVLTLDGGTTLK
jgi:hypothetical protein